MSQFRKCLAATYDSDSGELTAVKLSPAFRRETALMRADVLQDLIGALNTLYATAAYQAFPEAKPSRKPVARKLRFQRRSS